MANDGMHGPGEVTRLLRLARDGDPRALDEVIPLVYGELKRQAVLQLRREGRQLTFQPTALVHEAYLQLAENRRIQWKDRHHFFAVAAQLMRRILVDHARARLAQKRGGGVTELSLNGVDAQADDHFSVVDVLLLDETLTRLAALDARQAMVVELRVFGGFSLEETAEILDLSPRTITTAWQMARAWLTRELRAT